MNRLMVFCVMFLTSCSPKQVPVIVAPVVSEELLAPCAEPVKGPATNGGLAELAQGWKSTAHCNAEKLNSVALILKTGPK